MRDRLAGPAVLPLSGQHRQQAADELIRQRQTLDRKSYNHGILTDLRLKWTHVICDKMCRIVATL